MEKINRATELHDEARQDEDETQSATTRHGNEIRTLSELELMVASGGDFIVCW